MNVNTVDLQQEIMKTTVYAQEDHFKLCLIVSNKARLVLEKDSLNR